MRLTVLGSGAACPAPGGNCAGLLVEDQGRRVLIDCGHGVASALLALHPALDIDDIVISHMHADHFIDVLPLRFRVTRDLAGTPERRLRLHLPPGGVARLEALLEIVYFPADFCSNTFLVSEYVPGAITALGPLRLRAVMATHYIPACALRLDGTRSLAYTGDTAPSAAVAALADTVDLLIAEATLSGPEDGAMRGHLTPEEAGRLAAEADARRLLLTHFWWDADRAAVEARARRAFGGPVSAAYEGLVLHL